MIIFDLEYYVPVSDRDTDGFAYRPLMEDHLVLGGKFTEVFKGGESSREFWLWNYDSERQMLIEILDYLREVRDNQRLSDRGLWGVGISHSDVEVLKIRSYRYGLAGLDEIFQLFNGFLIYDLSSILVFENRRPFFFPVSHNEVMEIVGIPIHEKENGMVVWDYYDQGEFERIEKRNRKEVNQFSYGVQKAPEGAQEEVLQN